MARRKFSAEFKDRIVQEVTEAGSVAIVARKHNITPSQLRRWTVESKEIGLFKDRERETSKEIKRMQAEIQDLRLLLVEKELESLRLRRAFGRGSVPHPSSSDVVY